jgi:hypothetical protein
MEIVNQIDPSIQWRGNLCPWFPAFTTVPRGDGGKGCSAKILDKYFKSSYSDFTNRFRSDN